MRFGEETKDKRDVKDERGIAIKAKSKKEKVEIEQCF